MTRRSQLCYNSTITRLIVCRQLFLAVTMVSPFRVSLPAEHVRKLEVCERMCNEYCNEYFYLLNLISSVLKLNLYKCAN